MGSSPSAPQPIDPSQVATTQTQLNTTAGTQSQAGSMVNQSNPYGSINYTQTGVSPTGVPIYGANVNLSPQQQQLFNSFFGTQGTAGQQGANLISGANYGSVSPTQAIGTQTSGLTGQMMSQWLGAQQPFMQLQSQQLDAQLRNQGINPSPTANPSNPATWGAYEQQMGQLQQQQNTAVASAAAQFQPTAYNEAVQNYTLPASLGLQLAQFGSPTSPTSQAIQTPQLSISPASYESDVAQSENMQMQDYQAALAQQSAMMSGLFNLGGTVLGAGILKSDRKFKKHIRRVGKLKSGIPVYIFEFKGSNEPHIGVMADEVKKSRPDAVIRVGGYDYVNYSPYDGIMK